MVRLRNVLTIAILTLCGLFYAMPQAQAARFSGAYLMKICSVDDNGNETAPGAHAACQSYISGVIDYHNMLRSMKIAPAIDFCIPETVTLNEIHVKVLLYLEKNAQHDAFVAAPAVLMALYSNYPCGGGKKKR
ncbi:MAG: hypothetical protein JWO78_407 [Micavibrio sp.]|nr:hypothetical protein [Micavibrio sp.]